MKVFFKIKTASLFLPSSPSLFSEKSFATQTSKRDQKVDSKTDKFGAMWNMIIEVRYVCTCEVLSENSVKSR